MKQIEFVTILVFILVATSSFVLAEQTGSFGGSIDVDQDNPNGLISIDVGPSGSGNPYCGDGIVNVFSEYCDGSDLGGKTCDSYINDGKQYTGSLSCSSQCTFVTSSCTAPSEGNTDGGTDNGGSPGPSGGSRSGGGATCLENWTCSEWGKCSDGVQTRTCSDSRKCGTIKLKPVTSRTCTVEGASGEQGIGAPVDTSKNNGFFGGLAGITGAVIGGGAGSWIAAIIFILIIAGILFWVLVARKKKKTTSSDVKVKKN